LQNPLEEEEKEQALASNARKGKRKFQKKNT